MSEIYTITSTDLTLCILRPVKRVSEEALQVLDRKVDIERIEVTREERQEKPLQSRDFAHSVQSHVFRSRQGQETPHLSTSEIKHTQIAPSSVTQSTQKGVQNDFALTGKSPDGLTVPDGLISAHRKSDRSVYKASGSEKQPGQIPCSDFSRSDVEQKELLQSPQLHSNMQQIPQAVLRGLEDSQTLTKKSAPSTQHGESSSVPLTDTTIQNLSGSEPKMRESEKRESIEGSHTSSIPGESITPGKSMEKNRQALGIPVYPAPATSGKPEELPISSSSVILRSHNLSRSESKTRESGKVEPPEEPKSLRKQPLGIPLHSVSSSGVRSGESPISSSSVILSPHSLSEPEQTRTEVREKSVPISKTPTKESADSVYPDQDSSPSTLSLLNTTASEGAVPHTSISSSPLPHSLSRTSESVPLAPRPIRQAAGHVTEGMEPVFEQAYSVTQKTLGREPAPDDTAPVPVSKVNNTFNVNVSMTSEETLTVEQQEVLEEAIVNMLRTSARRQGLEV